MRSAPCVPTCRAARGERPTAFDRRCIPAVCVASRSNTAGIFPRRALTPRRIAGLGATRDFHHGLLGYTGMTTLRNNLRIGQLVDAPSVGVTTVLPLDSYAGISVVPPWMALFYTRFSNDSERHARPAGSESATLGLGRCSRLSTSVVDDHWIRRPDIGIGYTKTVIRGRRLAGQEVTISGRRRRYRCTVCGGTHSTSTGTAYNGLRCTRREFDRVAGRVSSCAPTPCRAGRSQSQD